MVPKANLVDTCSGQTAPIGRPRSLPSVPADDRRPGRGGGAADRSNINALGLIPIDIGLLAAALNTTVINPVANALNTVVLPTYLNKLLGIDIAGGDLGALDMKCDAVKLVA